MNAYRVSWFIDVEAQTPMDAAREALAMQRDPESIATVFTVQDLSGAVCVDAAEGIELPSSFCGRSLDDTSAMALIQDLLDGTDWGTETLEKAAEIVRDTGREVRDCDYSGPEC